MVVDLTNLFNEIIKKHTFIKFDQKYSKLKIEFLNVLVQKDEKQRLQKTLFKKKQTQSYLHPKFDNPALLKKSILYSQILCVKRIHSTNCEFECSYKVLQEQFAKRCYDHLQLKLNLRRLNF